MSNQQTLRWLGEGILNSYAQIFFSNNRAFAVLLLISTFVDVGMGFAGLLAIAITQLAAVTLGFDKELLRDGTYSYNGLMVGLVIGFYYQWNDAFIIILALGALLSLFLTIWLANTTTRMGIPFLSLPFLLAVWLILLSTPHFKALELVVRDPYSVKPLFFLSESMSLRIDQSLQLLHLPYLVEVYLKSLGAIMFQYNLFAGVLIAVGLLLYSRMAFMLSLIGFMVGYLFYDYLQGDKSQLLYTYIGFNFILTAIALGGFFIVPSWRSYLLVIITIPVIALLIVASEQILWYRLNLPVYSLPFNVMVLLTLLTLKLRVKTRGLDVTAIQYYSPEKNHYRHFNRKQRFLKETWFHVGLPFFGKWKVSQGHEGEITHKDDWKEAWDFVIEDNRGSSYREPGFDVRDYYCYEKPVLAPADGQIVEILDGISDNEVGGMDLEHNWGNTIVIKHGDYFYSKLSHLKSGSFKVSINDHVKKGEMLALCGNSGRSPEPHLHFQLQTTPYIGSKTLEYPISYYLTEQGNSHYFHTFEIPEEGQVVSNVAPTQLLKEAFEFIPGKILEFEVEGLNGGIKRLTWEVFTNIYNNSYIYCRQTKSVAYFVNNGTLFYFTDFTGNTQSLLHYFYLGAHRVLLGYYDDIEIEDSLLSRAFFNPLLHALHDITAPFGHYLSARYFFSFEDRDDEHYTSEISMLSRAEALAFNNVKRVMDFQFELKNHRIEQFTIIDGSKTITAKCI